MGPCTTSKSESFLFSLSSPRFCMSVVSWFQSTQALTTHRKLAANICLCSLRTHKKKFWWIELWVDKVGNRKKDLLQTVYSRICVTNVRRDRAREGKSFFFSGSIRQQQRNTKRGKGEPCERQWKQKITFSSHVSNSLSKNSMFNMYSNVCWNDWVSQ